MLNEINLSYNYLTTLPDLSMLSDSLERLWLLHNRIGTPHKSQYRQMDMLAHMDLSHNQIKDFDVDLALKYWPKMRIVDLQENYLKSPPRPQKKQLCRDRLEERAGMAGAHDYFAGLLQLFLAGNPFSCDRDIVWLYRGRDCTSQNNFKQTTIKLMA